MPTVTLNRTVFENLVGKKLPEDKLKDRISMLGTDLEEVTRDEIVVEIFPNRPDMLSEQGFARAFASFIGVKKGLREYTAKKSNYVVKVEKSVGKVRPYTVCAVVKGLTLDEEKVREIIQIQEKLHITYGRNRKKCAVGIYPLDKITFPITYKALAPEKIVFRPLEHPGEVNGLQILTEHAKGKEFAHLLEGHDRFPVFIDANGNVLSMPPIINSHDVGKVDADTKEVFIEFSGHDTDVLSKGLNMLVTALSDMGGELHTVTVEYSDETLVTPDLTPEKMKFDVSYANNILGLDLNEKQASELLERMGYSVSKGSVMVPCYRADVLHQIDLVEDIAIAYGYENFEPIIPNVATAGRESSLEKYRSVITDLLVGLGLQEVNTYHITNDTFQSTRMHFDAKPVVLANALTSEYNVLRKWITPDLLDVFSRNKHHEYPQHIFGFGTIFKHSEEKKHDASHKGSLIDEALRLGVGLCDEHADFTVIKQKFDYLMKMLNVDYTIEATQHPSFIAGRVARAYVNGVGVAYLGEISPAVIRNWELGMPVAVFELNVSELLAQTASIKV